MNNVYKSVEFDIDSICYILEHMGNEGKQRYTTIYNLDAILPIGYWVKGKNATFCEKNNDEEVSVYRPHRLFNA